LLIAVVAGEAIAGEASTGSLRYALAGPRSRGRYLLSKAGVAASICLALLAVLFAVSVASGLLAFGWHPLTPLIGGQSAVSTVANFSPTAALAKLGVGLAYVAAGMASVFSFGLLLSTVTTRPFVAVAGAVGLSVVSRVFNADYLPGVSAVSRYMPSNDIDLWQHLFSSPADTSGIGRFLLLQAGYFAAFSAAAWWLFTRRDVLT
jgi:ABC-2 type transport system permease protein